MQLPGRTITVKAQVPNPRRELQSGMFIEARLATDVRPSAVVIAEDGVLPIQGTNYVWVAVDGKAELMGYLSVRHVSGQVMRPFSAWVNTEVRVGQA